MANTLGYITGALSGLALLCGLSYSIENPQRALVPFNDTISSVERTLIKPEGYIGEGNLFEGLGDAIHDLRQRNLPSRMGSIHLGLENTPYQSQRLSSAHYRNSRDLAEHLNDELQEKERVTGITKGDLTLAGTGLGLGIVAVLGYANRKRP
ncbi:MAG: hypothetical protein QT08_C0011G0010 [archaeon GW2011_AR17]|nr:MAG: hypothetical protein QT08_C0011G0010 [archaeon GW2011_AR17]MBS3154468.1 hypothetical protein [Candidatus Woesearchaeota archaeon]HIH15115.1 hypothetical protein [Nanoarchaeota archaeon]HII14515.1 hypothetical protein [Nanoarchaeota archaeon]HIJ04503.1 hypothetical protein [Nanoarchaeota archaeon]